jgi:hypothetical protein
MTREYSPKIAINDYSASSLDSIKWDLIEVLFTLDLKFLQH